MKTAVCYSENHNIIAKINVSTERAGDVLFAKISTEDIPENTFYVDFMPEFAVAEYIDNGYMVAPRGGPYVKNSYMLCSFREQPDYEHIVEDSALPILGFLKNDICFVAIVAGMRFDYDTVVGVRNGRHYIYPRFKLDGEGAYEDICVEYRYLYGDDANYSGMARAYREYQLSRGACIPLKERIKGNPALEYAARSMNVRIRLGMKPIPTPVLEQTPENEPEMVISCDFDRMRELIDEFRKQGIKHAELCLIGWNLKGHDGRYPDMFPVEDSLGGEEKLRSLISYGQSLGYQMTCHSNSSDAYSISSMWNPEDILMTKDKKISVDPNPWSGGRMYQLCPKVALEQARITLPKIAALGFRGIHYIDVISLHPPRKCYSDKHPLNKNGAVEINNGIMKLSKELFGGFSSEGGYDTNIGNLDFALVVHNNTMSEQIPICDRVIPLWELVYHGIVLHNTSWESESFNAIPDDNSTENRRKLLKNIEFGGRALIYFHHMFHGHESEIGDGYSTAPGKMEDSVKRAKEYYLEYEKLSYLQYEYMQSHRKISDGIFETVYSDGTKITVDYNKNEYSVTGGTKYV